MESEKSKASEAVSIPQVYGEMRAFAREVFQIAEWTIVAIAVQYAYGRLGGWALGTLYVALYLLLVAYTSTSLTKLFWWKWPPEGPDSPKGKKRIFLAVGLLLASTSVMYFTTEVHERLLQLQVLTGGTPAAQSGSTLSAVPQPRQP